MPEMFISSAGRTAGDQTWKLMTTGLVANAERWAAAAATKSGQDIDLALRCTALYHCYCLGRNGMMSCLTHI